MNIKAMAAALLLLPAFQAQAGDHADVERGRYLVRLGGCNDCHTDGYMARDGEVPESQWLTGSTVGFQGPWGTSYAANLRLRVAAMTEEQWLATARARRLPPMPWFTLSRVDEDDLRAMYRYIRSLGAAGTAAPAWVAPGGTVTTPFIVFVPQTPAAPDKIASAR